MSTLSNQIAARAWCTPETEKIVMDVKLALAFGDILEEYIEALIWCSGSPDFGEGGVARAGWEKICEPLISQED